MKIYEKIGLSPKDICLVPGDHSGEIVKPTSVLPSKVDISTFLTPKIKLNVPILSAAMEFVGPDLAIALAREGGAAVFHINMPLKKLLKAVTKVKRAQSLFIDKPYTAKTGTTLKEVIKSMEDIGASSVLVVDDNNILKGIFTHRDKIKHLNADLNKKIDDEGVMTTELITAPFGISAGEAKERLIKSKKKKLPVINEKGELAGLFVRKDVFDNVDKYPNACLDIKGRLVVGAALKTEKIQKVIQKVRKLIDVGTDFVVVDTSCGHRKDVIDLVRALADNFSGQIGIIAGNVVTEAAGYDLSMAGADGIRVGMSIASICTTGPTVGTGRPQISAVIDVAKGVKRAIEKTGRFISLNADGGIVETGDYSKVIACGATSATMGRGLAGTKESDAPIGSEDGRRRYQGMGSLPSMKAGGRFRYNVSTEKDQRLLPQGVVANILEQGSVADVFSDFTTALKIAMAQCGANNVEEFHEKVGIEIISYASIIQMYPHDVEVVK